MKEFEESFIESFKKIGDKYKGKSFVINLEKSDPDSIFYAFVDKDQQIEMTGLENWGFIALPQGDKFWLFFVNKSKTKNIKSIKNKIIFFASENENILVQEGKKKAAVDAAKFHKDVKVAVFFQPNRKTYNWTGLENYELGILDNGGKGIYVFLVARNTLECGLEKSGEVEDLHL